MLSPVECMLKADNYTAAALLDSSHERLSSYLRLAALWRARAIHLRVGGRMTLINEPFEPFDEPELWRH